MKGGIGYITQLEADYMSLDTVKRIFPRLEKAGYLLTGNFNEDTRDKTKWYATNDEQLEALFW